MANQEDKMYRFLKSIGIDNTEDFDVRFDLCTRNMFNRQQIDMVIVKDTPWSYPLLQEFQEGLNTITYKYSLTFFYIQKPSLDDVIRLFEDWHLSIYRIKSDAYLRSQGDHLIFSFESEEEKKKNASMVRDFKDFLGFIFYDFIVEAKVEHIPESKRNKTPKFKLEIQESASSTIEEETIEENIQENKIISKPDEVDFVENEYEKSIAIKGQEIEEAIEKISEIDVSEKIEEENSEEYNEESDEDKEEETSEELSAKELIAKEQEDEMARTQAFLMQVMKENYEAMKKEREFKRRFKKGNYNPVESIGEIDTNSGNVDFDGTIFSNEEKSYGDKPSKYTIGVNDNNGDAIYVTMREGKTFSKDKVKDFVPGANVRVRGYAFMDEFSKQLTITGHFLDLLPPRIFECDKAENKRVELHLHSKMSAMDATGTMDQYCAYAKAMGMKALAITDHGVASGYHDAQEAAKKNGLKMLYGCEFYMIDDSAEYIKNPAEIELNKANYVVFDLETTGLSCRYNRIMEFGGVRIEHGTEVARLDILINPETLIPAKISKLTHITQDMVDDKPTFHEVKEQILNFIKDAILVSHNADFDVPFLNESLIRDGDEPLNNPVIDTLALSRYLFPENRNHRLGTLCRNFDVKYDANVAHRADYDAYVLNDVWQIMLVKLTKDNHKMKHKELANLELSNQALEHLHPYHMIAFAKNMAGLRDLFELISIAHCDYISADTPKIPKSQVERLRKNLLISSACCNGEIFEIVAHKNFDSLKKAIRFYDYIEIQPLGNYIHLVNRGDFETIDDVKNIVLDIVKASEEEGKMVCATGDVHYCLPEDKIFRDVYISAKGLGGGFHPLNLNPRNSPEIPNYDAPDQHFRNTDSMLEEMAFLGEEKAYEVTVTNTNLIADSIEELVPLPNKTLCPPNIPHDKELLTNMCYNKAHELYGDPLPEFIENRLKTELDGIINHGYAVIYYISHKIVKDANEHGYLVGSRGSVGSSFVATMSDITEVNPLPPHYRCPNCKHFEFSKDEYPDIRSGYDLPEKKCPACGADMVHDGQDIPFETFLGFNADKTPDIDLNFPGDYQAQAHNYTRKFLGEANVFRAGTIETVAEKTAFGYARGYFERLGYNPDDVSKAKIAYLASGCIGVRRTTGQHPGGIVVVPSDRSVYDFTPVQYPANKKEKEGDFDDEKAPQWKTTHFEYHCMDNVLLKFDELGHVDPVALKMMADLTHVDIKSIPMNDKKVISLFSSPKALGMHANYLNQKTGAMGIPEFGTDFVRGMLESTNPKTFSDLVIISGLSHGTDVWNGNAEKLIHDKITDLRGVIGCRDDIMTYLISKGVNPSLSFKIMESVRKGRGLSSEQEAALRANNVPDYYINSCKKIKYMFPKGHATAYVMMAIRVGYFKIYYPLEFYAVFFSARCDQWDLKAAIKGEEGIIERLEELKTKSKTEALSPKETEINKMLQIALEMAQRGYSIVNIDLYKSKATEFVVDHEHKCLIAPFVVLDNLGGQAAESVVEARMQGEFTSKEDLLRRTKLSSTNLKDLDELGVLADLNDTDQLSLFDFD